MTDETTLLESVLDKTSALVAATRPDQRTLPTPCPDYDVSALTSHLVGWLQRFAAAAEQDPSPPDPAAYTAGDDALADFHDAAERAVTAFRDGALDREISLFGSGAPGRAVLGMMLMEYVGHGWDLAQATGQPVPYSDEEAEAALAAGRQTLKPEYRGAAAPFADEVEVAETAGSVERLVGFLGRRP